MKGAQGGRKIEINQPPFLCDIYRVVWGLARHDASHVPRSTVTLSCDGHHSRDV